MSTSATLPQLDDPGLLSWLESSNDAALDDLPFGVIGFDAEGHVRRYSRHEAHFASFTQEAVLGQQVFIELAPCMNNYLIAGRFEEAAADGSPLDITLPYVLTFRMKPTRVRLRLLSSPQGAIRYILVNRLGA